jgi:hypothetical protein
VGFIKWPQVYAAEAEKLKGGIFNDRKCIKERKDWANARRPTEIRKKQTDTETEKEIHRNRERKRESETIQQFYIKVQSECKR